MSKLADRIRKALRAESAPMGFAASSARAKSPTLLIAALFTSLSADRAGDAVAGGADTCLLAVGEPKAGELEAALARLGETPLGVLPRQADRQSLDRLSEAGVDYVVLAPDAPAAALALHPKVGRVLALEGDISDTHLRAVDLLPVEALFLRDWRGPLTVRGQMELHRIAGLSRTPLMVPLQPQADAQELEALRDAGVVLLALDGDRRDHLEALPALRRTVDGLPARRRRREERADAILPAPPATPAAEEEEEEEEGDDDWAP